MVKNLPTSAGVVGDVGSIPELGRSPGGGMATHSNIFAWRIPWTEEPGGHKVAKSQARLKRLITEQHCLGKRNQKFGYSTMDWKTKERPLFTNGELSESSDKKLCLKEKCVCYPR